MKSLVNNKTYRLILKGENVVTVFIVLSSVLFVEFLMHVQNSFSELSFIDYISNDIIFILIFLSLYMFFLSFYKSSFLMQTKFKFTVKVIISSLITYVISISILMMSSKFIIDPLHITLASFISTFLLILFKYILHLTMHNKIKLKLLLIGSQKEVEHLAVKIMKNAKFYEVKYIIYECQNLISENQRLSSLLKEVDEVYLANKLSDAIKNAIITACFDMNKPFSIAPELYELSIAKAKIDQIEDFLIYRISSLRFTLTQRFVKRTFDILLALLLLISTIPIILISIIVLKIENISMPVFFIQQRLTRNNKTFGLIKLRTMIKDAELETGPIISFEKDPRITRIGRILRKLRIDELPQAINILKGEMSFVGPRPEREHFVKQYILENPTYRYRMNVKAGLTGLAQSLGKYNSSFNDKLSYDIYYIATYNFISDLKIILYTIKAVIDGTTEKNIDDAPKTIDDFLGKDQKLICVDPTIQLHEIIKENVHEN